MSNKDIPNDEKEIREKIKREIEILKYYFNPQILISEIVKEKGYHIGDYYGNILKEPKKEGVGIIDKKTKIPFVKTDGYFAGFIWVNKYSASPHKKWNIEIYGSDYFDDIIEISRRANLFYHNKIKLDFRLISENPISLNNLERERLDSLLKFMYTGEEE